MLKRFYWLGLGALAGWLAWEWLRQREQGAGTHEPQFAPQPTAGTAAAAYARADDDQVSPLDPPADAEAAPAAEIAPAIVGYCARCREKRSIQDAQETTSANGRRAARGTCPVCGAKMFTFLESR